jgi:hypothetical protein
MVDHFDDDEETWQTALKDLQRQLVACKEATFDETRKEEEKKLIVGMKRVGDSHPDPKVRMHWEEKAKAFEKGNQKEKDNILEELGRGLLILLLTPFALVGAVLFGAGAIIYGVGSIIKGLGTVMTGGLLNRKNVEDHDPDSK